MFQKPGQKAFQLLQRNANYLSHQKKFGLSLYSFNALSRYPQGAKKNVETVFNKHRIHFSSPFWFLHSVKELFVEEVYKFSSEKQAPYIIDCGSNIGLSVIYFKQMFPRARISAFEADPIIFKTMQSNVGEYQFNDVSLFNAAVWYEKGFINFSAEGSVGGSIDFGNNSKANMVSIPTVRLKDYLNEEVDFLKIDIEGAEYEVMKDCKDALRNVKNLFIEYHEEKNGKTNLHEILDWVDGAGFKYYIREAWNNMSYPFTKTYNDHFHSQLNISCFRA